MACSGRVSENRFIARSDGRLGEGRSLRSFLAPETGDLLDKLPEEAGVYILRDESGNPLYVGKSEDIRKRVRSHFAPGRSSLPVARVGDVESILTGTELEALILECNLIKRLRPPYNARLKDDKSYPYIKITVGEAFPGIYVSRIVRDDGSIYLGPYADVGSARRSIKILRQIFPIRGCRRRMDRPSRPCLDFHIKRCAGPCTGRVDPGPYASDVQGMIRALQGRRNEVLDGLRSSMYEASRAQNYERAAVIRDRLNALERTTLRQRLSSPGPGDVDVLGVATKNDDACVQIMFVRGGSLIDQEHFLLDSAGYSPGELLASFVKEYYSSNPVPPRILAPFPMDEAAIIALWFQSRSSRPVEIATPAGRDEQRLMAMATKNGEFMLNLERQAMGEALKRGLQDLARALDLVCLPRVVEAFDLSSISGKFAAGSMVRFRWGRASKSLYRRFRVSSSPGRDDYAMMREVVTRRFKRGFMGEEALPDLVLVDGGPGQASAAAQALSSLGLTVPVVGLAKRLEELYRPGSRQPIALAPGSAGHMLVRTIRDEAHRFAISYHRVLRHREVSRSELDAVPGIGPKRKATLLRRFGGVDRIRRSDERELAAVPGISADLARSILRHLRGQARGRVD